ncbi:hypothetical protein NL501_31185, partial [Klebsiella pneumoniae]|nr:hypothetical protein [Klebsiella pneumoniae]
MLKVVGTVMGNQVPGLIKGIYNNWLHGPFLNAGQVLFQLFQCGHAQDDCVTIGTLELRVVVHPPQGGR